MLKYVFLLLFITQIICGDKCPPQSIVFPCECGYDMIYCGFKETKHLKHVFKALSEHIAVNATIDKHFDTLDIRNASITELEDNVFADITFTNIFLSDASELRRISRNALSRTAHFVRDFRIEGESQLGRDHNIHELFDAINSLSNLEKLFFDNHYLTSIASYGLTNERLRDLDFNFNRRRVGSIKRVHNYAFYHLDNLVDLDLTHQKIEFIAANAFTFKHNSSKALNIFLDNNNLNASSFESGLFNNTNRDLVIYLRNNNITYLDEDIFYPLLKRGDSNKIDITGNPLVLDCRSQWLVKNREVHPFYQFLGGQFTNQPVFITIVREHHFKDC